MMYHHAHNPRRNPHEKALISDDRITAVVVGVPDDGDVTIFDATAIQRYLAQLPTNPNIGKPV